MLQDLMSEAMEETDGQPAVNSQQNGDDLKYDFFVLFFCTDARKSSSNLNFASTHYQVVMRSAVRTLSHLTQTCFCSRMRAET